MGVALYVPCTCSVADAIEGPQIGKLRHEPFGIRGAWLKLFIGTLRRFFQELEIGELFLPGKCVDSPPAAASRGVSSVVH